MPWSTRKTEAIVITSLPFREADRRYSAITPYNGKISFLGRGAQKSKAKLASHLEPFALVDLEIVQGRRSTTVISVERKERFIGIEQNVQKRLLATAACQVVDAHTREDDVDEELFREMYTWFRFLHETCDMSETRSTFLLGAFFSRFLSGLGYTTELDECIQCREAISPLSFRWHALRGGLVCSSCAEEDPREWSTAVQMSEDSVKLLRCMREVSYADLLSVSLSGEVLGEASKALNDMAVFHLPVEMPVPFWGGVTT